MYGVSVSVGKEKEVITSRHGEYWKILTPGKQHLWYLFYLKNYDKDWRQFCEFKHFANWRCIFIGRYQIYAFHENQYGRVESVLHVINVFDRIGILLSNLMK